MWNRIAYDWRVTVDEAQARISSLQFTQICAFLSKHAEMDHWHFGMVAATVANVSGRKKGARPYAPKDFYPRGSGPSPLNAAQRKEIERRKRKKQ